MCKYKGLVTINKTQQFLVFFSFMTILLSWPGWLMPDKLHQHYCHGFRVLMFSCFLFYFVFCFMFHHVLLHTSCLCLFATFFLCSSFNPSPSVFVCFVPGVSSSPLLASEFPVTAFDLWFVLSFVLLAYSWILICLAFLCLHLIFIFWLCYETSPFCFFNLPPAESRPGSSPFCLMLTIIFRFYQWFPPKSYTMDL